MPSSLPFIPEPFPLVSRWYLSEGPTRPNRSGPRRTMATIRQIAANQANAQKSTGPKTEEGKSRSRANSLKHGLAGAGVVDSPDDLDAIAERMESWRSSYVPINAEQEWQFRQIVVNSVRIDRCQREEFAIRRHEKSRAEISWDEDRTLAAEELGARISRNPSMIVYRLRRTRQGCLWLLERWHRLGLILRQEGEWTEAQTRLAMDLLGIPPELREMGLPVPPKILVTEQMDLLGKLREDSLDDLDAFERDAACNGPRIDPLQTPRAALPLRESVPERIPERQNRHGRANTASAHRTRPRRARSPAAPRMPSARHHLDSDPHDLRDVRGIQLVQPTAAPGFQEPPPSLKTPGRTASIVHPPAPKGLGPWLHAQASRSGSGNAPIPGPTLLLAPFMCPYI